MPIKLWSQIDDFFVSTRKAPSVGRVVGLVYHGYFTILLFKNISSNNYTNSSIRGCKH